MKLGRNDLCWCGSGIKYKKCHLDREKQDPVNPGIIHKQLSGFYSHKYCSVPKRFKTKCTGKIIKAHSVSKSSSLKAISENGHVLSSFGCVQQTKGKIIIEPVRVGINNASTFTGFCAFHDKKLFSPIENSDFEQTEKNCFLVAYRAIARELFVKQRAEGVFDLVRQLDKGKNISQQRYIQEEGRRVSTNNDLTKNDLNYIKTALDEMLESDSYSNIQHFVFKLDSFPRVMTSAAMGLTFDFQGNIIQQITNNPEKIPDYITINSFSSNDNGYIILSWLKEHNESCQRFLKSLQMTESQEDSVIKFIFTFIENVYFSEPWWRGLGDSKRKEILTCIEQGVSKPTYSDALKTKNSFNAFKIIESKEINS